MAAHRRVIQVLLAVAIAGCASDRPAVRDRLDERTSATVTHIDVPLILYRDNSAVAAHARDYVYVGPVSVNRMGEYRYFLWMGIWSTVIPSDPVRIRDTFESVVLYADGEPMPLDAGGWTAGDIGMSESVYSRPVASAIDAYYPVTLDQVRLLSESRDVLLRTGGSDGRSYVPWDSQRQALTAMRRFVAAGLP